MYTRSTYLRPAVRSDARFLLDLELQPGSNTAWRFGGYVPTVEQYEKEMGGYLRADVVTLRSTGSRIGLVGLRSANPMSGIAYLNLLSSPTVTGNVRMLEALAAFVLSAYEDPRIRKIYAEVPHFAWSAFKAGDGRFFDSEGCLIDYVATPDGFADLHVIAFGRDRWDEMAAELRARIGLLQK